MIHACWRILAAALEGNRAGCAHRSRGTKSDDAQPRVSLAGLACAVGLFLDRRLSGHRTPETAPAPVQSDGSDAEGGIAGRRNEAR